MKYKTIFVVLALMSLMGFAPQSHAAIDIFLKIDDVKGEATDRVHQDEIEVVAWSFGGSQTGTTHSGKGGGAGKVNIQDISITKWVDSATPPLMRALVSGKHYEQAILTVRRAGPGGRPGSGRRAGPAGGQSEYFVITMDKVIVTSVSMGGSGGDDRMTEEITLNFASFHISYNPPKRDGSVGDPVEMKFDIAKNK